MLEQHTNSASAKVTATARQQSEDQVHNLSQESFGSDRRNSILSGLGKSALIAVSSMVALGKTEPTLASGGGEPTCLVTAQKKEIPREVCEKIEKHLRPFAVGNKRNVEVKGTYSTDGDIHCDVTVTHREVIRIRNITGRRIEIDVFRVTQKLKVDVNLLTGNLKAEVDIGRGIKVKLDDFIKPADFLKLK